SRTSCRATTSSSGTRSGTPSRVQPVQAPCSRTRTSTVRSAAGTGESAGQVTATRSNSGTSRTPVASVAGAPSAVVVEERAAGAAASSRESVVLSAATGSGSGGPAGATGAAAAGAGTARAPARRRPATAGGRVFIRVQPASRGAHVAPV